MALTIILVLAIANCLFGDQNEVGLATAASHPPTVYSNDFVVIMQPEIGIPGSNYDHAERLAKRHGFENRGTVSAV